MKQKLTPGRLMQYVVIYALSAMVSLPVLNIFISAFKSNVDINRSLPFPSAFQLGNFTSVLRSDIFYSGMFNSVLITAGALLISSVLCAMAAYPLARNKQKAYTAVYMLFLSAMMIPTVANLVPIYSLMKNLGLLNNRFGMILMYAGSVSMGILLFTSFIKTVPEEIERAAEIDGCNYFQRFWLVTLPLLKPVTLAYIMISILNIWNDFLLPMLFLQERGKQTITLAVYTFKNERGSDWGAIFALMSLAALGPMILFITNQKYFFEGMTIGAVKA